MRTLFFITVLSLLLIDFSAFAGGETVPFSEAERRARLAEQARAQAREQTLTNPQQQMVQQHLNRITGLFAWSRYCRPDFVVRFDNSARGVVLNNYARIMTVNPALYTQSSSPRRDFAFAYQIANYRQSNSVTMNLYNGIPALALYYSALGSLLLRNPRPFLAGLGFFGMSRLGHIRQTLEMNVDRNAAHALGTIQGGLETYQAPDTNRHIGNPLWRFLFAGQPTNVQRVESLRRMS